MTQLIDPKVEEFLESIKRMTGHGIAFDTVDKSAVGPKAWEVRGEDDEVYFFFTDAGGRLHTEVGDQVAVIGGCPGRPVGIVELNADRFPRCTEAGEVAEHRVLRRIVPRVLTQASDQAGPVAAGGRRPAGCGVVRNQTR